jgi:hypothetical protein
MPPRQYVSPLDMTADMTELNDSAMAAADQQARRNYAVQRARMEAQDPRRKRDRLLAFAASQAAGTGPWEPGDAMPGYIVHPQEAPSNILKVSGLGSVTHGGVVVVNATYNFQESGEVVGLGLTTQGDGSAAGLASLALRIQVGPKLEEVVNNGVSFDYACFAALVGTSSFQTFLMRRYVYVHENWTFYVKNFSAGTDYTPEVCMFFRADPTGLRQLSP